jgi:light-regulated signal transduction histidine kinase (bacteriophytochrome)
MGGVDYIYKPINPDLLRAKVAVFVELYRKNEQLMTNEKELLSANQTLHKEIEERKLSEEKINLLNQQLIEKNEHLKNMNEELDRFAYVASHDLQEPLRKIRVFSDKITSAKEDQKQVARYLEKISSSSKRMQSLINNLLKFSRYSLNPADFIKVDLNELLTESVTELEEEMEKNHVVLHTDSLPVVEAVPELMLQVFYNLISNAIKFKQKNQAPIIHISSRQMKAGESKFGDKYVKGNRYYGIKISDNGIGFDEQYAGDIFMVFKRLHSSHEFDGTGIGLSICKKIIDKHNGFITASAKPKEGATFLIELPEKQLHTS